MDGMSGMPGMGSMAGMGGGHHHGGGGAHGGGSHAIHMLPAGLAIAWMIVFVAILLTHARHAATDRGERRLWHVGHVLMAGSMALMYAPAAHDPVHVSPVVWQLVFCAAAAGSATGVARGTRASGSLVRVLWLALALDLVGMVYMWRPDRSLASLGWLLCGYFCAQALLWASRLTGGAARWPNWSPVPVGASPAAGASPQARALCVSMCAMTVGMAYMLVAMQLSLLAT